MSELTLVRVFENMNRRVTTCVETQGYHFQHLLQLQSNLKHIIFNCCLFTLLVYTYCADLFVAQGT
jgi:hypothetical protein